MPIGVALIAVAVLVAEIVFSMGVDRCAMDIRSGEYRMCFIQEPAGAGYSFLTRFILGASVVFAVASLVRIWAIRFEVIVFVVWTLVFAWVTSNAFVPAREMICLPDPSGTSQSIPPTLGVCYLPWVPGFPRMAVWVLVSAAILAVGYFFRRLTSVRGTPAVA